MVQSVPEIYVWMVLVVRHTPGTGRQSSIHYPDVEPDHTAHDQRGNPYTIARKELGGGRGGSFRSRAPCICDRVQALRDGLFFSRAFLGDFLIRHGFSGAGLIG